MPRSSAQATPKKVARRTKNRATGKALGKMTRRLWR